MTNFLLNGAATPANTWWIYVILIGLVLIMLIVPSITNRKRVKEYNQMINSVRVGDTIRTVGGVIGRITKINDKDGYKTIIVETGAKNSKTSMEFDMASVATVLKGSNKPAEKPVEDVVTGQDKLEEKEEKLAELEKDAEAIEQKVESTNNAETKEKKFDTSKTSTKTKKSNYRVR